MRPRRAGYWRQHREHILGRELHTIGRCVFTPNYTAFYRDDLDAVFTVLDELADASPDLSTAEFAVASDNSTNKK